MLFEPELGIIYALVYRSMLASFIDLYFSGIDLCSEYRCMQPIDLNSSRQKFGLCIGYAEPSDLCPFL